MSRRDNAEGAPSPAERGRPRAASEGASLSRHGAKRRAEALRVEIWQHRKRYYVDDDPTLSDGEYDALERELLALEARFPDLVTEDSPTRRVGVAITGDLPTARHALPMLSLDNVGSHDEFVAWNERLLRALGGQADDPQEGDRPSGAIPFVAELKIDGASVSLIYEKGSLIRAVTRGDGFAGEEVTANIRTIPTVPLRLLEPIPLVEVRGEVYYPLKAFHDMNRQREEEGEAAFANPRNAAAGSLRLLDPALASRRPLALFVWGLARVEGRPLPPTHHDGLQFMRDLGIGSPVSMRST